MHACIRDGGGKIRKQTIFMLITLLFTLILAGTVSASNETWHNESLSKIGVSGGYTSLVMDSSGNPHISYYDNNTGNLKYTYKSGNKWINETVDTGNKYYFTSLALDSSGNPHISYWDSKNLKYAFKYMGSWYKDTVATSNVYYASLDLDSSGKPHISYSNSLKLFYATKTSSTWNIETVDSSGTYVGGYNSLALDSSGNPHISYQDGTNPTYNLKYAYKNSLGWHIETVDSIGDVGEYTSIAIGSSGNPHISYYDYTNKNLKYAYKDSTGWHIETADTGNVGEYTSLALDSTNNPHISYYDGSNNDLKYAYKDITGWHKQTVDNTWTCGHWNSIALDSSGKPYISYTGGSYGDLRYAYIPDTTLPKACANIKTGLYNTNKVIYLKISENGNIYYTKNGTTPTTASTRYTGPITITSTTTLKFIAVDLAGNKSPVYTEKYIIDKTAPKITSTYPKNGATGISRTSTIKIKFSEKIKASTYWSKIYVKNKYGSKVSISKSITGNYLYIKTTHKRSSYSYYTVYIPYKAVKDYAGNKLAKSYTFKFRTQK
ncbi:Ig-like domain-containing protein [Methanobacterium sp.]|uniref:Ig-like domain-containing protein n=1 Tax=Methanobacterium sp. TaxID=2164 RepID=UPI003C740944